MQERKEELGIGEDAGRDGVREAMMRAQVHSAVTPVPHRDSTHWGEDVRSVVQHVFKFSPTPCGYSDDRATAVGRRRAFQKDGGALAHILGRGHELP
jgi:hypothetical protein